MKHQIGNYYVERFESGNLGIDYRRSLKDFYLIIMYSALALPLLYFSYKIIGYIQVQREGTGTGETIIRYFFAIALLLFGISFLIIALKSLIKPCKKVFYVENATKKLRIRKNIFKSYTFDFFEIKGLEIGAKDITVENYHEGRNYKRQLYIIEMNLILKNKNIIKVHEFNKPNLLISLAEKQKNKSLKETSRQVTALLCKECNIEYNWKGTIIE